MKKVSLPISTPTRDDTELTNIYGRKTAEFVSWYSEVMIVFVLD